MNRCFITTNNINNINNKYQFILSDDKCLIYMFH